MKTETLKINFENNVSLANRPDDVDYGDADISSPDVQSGLGRGKIYRFLNQPASQEFLIKGDRANDDSDVQIFSNWIFQNDYIFSESNKREIKEYCFSSLANAIFPEVEIEALKGELQSTWVGTIGQIETTSRAQIALETVIPRLISFSTLREDWDSYGAENIEWRTIARVLELLFTIFDYIDHENDINIPIPFVAPLPDGGIQIDWKTCFKELIIVVPEDPKEKLEYLTVRRTIQGEKETETVANSIDEIVDVVKEWFLANIL